jgi:hypothetical protein
MRVKMCVKMCVNMCVNMSVNMSVNMCVKICKKECHMWPLGFPNELTGTDKRTKMIGFLSCFTTKNDLNGHLLKAGQSLNLHFTLYYIIQTPNAWLLHLHSSSFIAIYAKPLTTICSPVSLVIMKYATYKEIIAYIHYHENF